MQQYIKKRYRIDNLVGQGGMGEVYQTYDRLTGQTLALKRVTVPKKHLDVVTQAPASQSDNAILANEFRTLASLRHPNIISVLDYGFDEELRPFFTMDFLQNGIPIDEHLVDKPFSEKIKYSVEVLQALRYLHQRKILHRDLKPANVLVKNDRAYLLDFGLAIDTAYVTENDDIAGTLAYLAPELFQGETPSIASDLYAFGVLLYELVIGEHPFPYETQSDLIQFVLLEAPKFPKYKIDEALENVIFRLLSKHPQDRYTSVSDTIYALCDATGTPYPIETREIRESFLAASTFVGREAELQTLAHALEQTLKNQAEFWLISGESGVGKSRLMEELRTHALVRGITVMRGQGIAEGGLPYQIWRDILPHILLLTEITDDELQILSLIVPNIEQILERNISDSTQDMSIVQSRLPLIISSLIVKASEQAPLLLQFEDLQWASESKEILQTIIPTLSNQKVMIVANYRSDEAPHLAEELSMMKHLPLGRLDENDIRQLSIAMLGETRETQNVVELVKRESEGNAFFIIEVMRTLADEFGQLSEIGRATLPAQVFAGGIQSVIQRRLSKVPAWTLHPMQIAAIIGRRINAELMAAILPDLDMDSWLTTCSDAAIIAVIGTQWQFSHDKVREFVLANIETELNKRLNLQVADAIEEFYADELGNYALVLAQHYRIAEHNEKEGIYAAMAANNIIEFNPPLARDFIKRAITLNAHEHHEYPDSELAYYYHLYGQTLIRISQYEDARKALDTALSLYQDIGDELGAAKVNNNIGEWGLRVGQLQQGLSILEKGLITLKEYDDTRQMMYAHMNIGVIHSSQHQYEDAKHHFEMCFELAQELDDQIMIAKALNNLANMYDFASDWDKALELHRQALEIRRRLNDRHGIAYSLVNMGAIEADKCNYEIKRKYYHEALKHIQAVGDLRAQVNILNGLSGVEKHFENIDSALMYAQEALELAHQINEPQSITKNLINLGDLYFQENRKIALKYYDEALGVVKEIDVIPLKLMAINKIINAILTDISSEILVKWLSSALEHATNYNKRDELEISLSKLKEITEPDAFDEVIKLGKSIELNTVLTEIIAYREDKS